MWITADVNIPQQLLDAAAKDEVVFFVGAGASFNPPSNLPSYEQLATKLAEEADEPLPHNGEQLDRFIGMLPDNFNAHKRTKDLMRGDDIHCNSTHEAIVRLASSVKTPRIVTTNYDLLLEEAAQKQNCDLGRSYYGPAVPIGSDFSGLLYLHGSVDSPDREIVLDDRDFARAYLSEGWATRFLLKLFETYTVVFIGYSFGDVIMRYLALGISSHARPRYIFLSEEDMDGRDNEWQHNGITPIPYPAANGHHALVEALTAWTDYISSDYNAYKKRLPGIIENGVPKDAVDLDYVRAALSTDEGAQCFVDIIEREEGQKKADKSKIKREWLSWVMSPDVLREIFTERDPKTQNEIILLNWFITSFVQRPEELDFVLHVLCKLQSSMSNWLFERLHECVSYCISQNGRRDLVPAFTVLMTSMQGHSAPCALDEFDFSSIYNSDVSPQILSLAIRPYLKLAMPFWGNGIRPNAEIVWSCDKVEKNNSEFSLETEEFVSFAESGLQRASALLQAYQGGDEYSHLSRPSIEPSDQNMHVSDLQSMFIDILRNYAHAHKDQQDELIHRWWNSGSALLKRLAINTIAFSDWDADRKVNWILDQDYLFDVDAHHEVYTVLKVSAPGLGENSKIKILKYLRNKFNFLKERYSDERTALYGQFDVLQWLLRNMNGDMDSWPEAWQWANELAQKHGFSPREHADYYAYAESAHIVTTGISNERFIDLLTHEPSIIEEKMFAGQNKIGEFGFTSIELFNQQIREVVAHNPQVGLTLWELVNRHEEHASVQYRCSIIRGWGMALLDDCRDSILDLLRNLLPRVNQDEVNAISTFLNMQMDQGKTTITEKMLQVMSDFALQLWNEHSGAFTLSNGQQWENDPVTCSLNCWPGELAYFWIERIRWRYIHDPGSWNGFDADEKDAIHHFIEDEGDFSRPVWTALLVNINMLHSLDNEDVESWLFDLMGKAGTEFIWNSILPNPNFNIRLIDIVFYKSCIDEFEYLSHLSEYKRQSFLLQVFRMITYGELKEKQRTRLLSKVVTVENGAYAALFMDQVSWAFEFRLDSKDRDMVWDLWLHQFIEDRHAGKGRNWGEEERVAFAKLVPLLGAHLKEGAEYLSDSFPKVTGYDLNEIIMLDNIDCIPQECAEAFIAFYMRLFMQPGVFHVWKAGELLQKLANKFGMDKVSSLASLAKEKRIIPDTWNFSPKKEIHSDGKEGEA